MPCPLQTAATATFESLALLFAEEAPTDAQRAVPLAHAVRVTFGGEPAQGAFAGALTVAVTDDVATALAANMLGVDPAHADARARRDALGEVGNVVCGNVLPLLGGRTAVFHLAAPVPVPLAEALAELDAGVPGVTALHAALGIDGGRAMLALHVPSGLPLLPADADAALAADALFGDDFAAPSPMPSPASYDPRP